MGTNTNLAMEIYSKAVLKGLSVKLPSVKQFALDLSEEAKSVGETVRVALVTADEAADWNDDSNNFGRTTMTPVDKDVKLTSRAIAGFAITPAQTARFQPQWWEGKGELNAHSVAKKVCKAITDIVTKDNYSQQTVVTLASFNREAVADLRAKLVSLGIDPSAATLNLNPDFFSKLLGQLDSQVYGGREAIVGGTIPGLLGFNAIVEQPTFTNPGFVNLKSAIAMAARVEALADETPYAAVKTIVEPMSGLPLQNVIYTSGPTGKMSMSSNVVYGVEVGLPESLVRLVSNTK